MSSPSSSPTPATDMTASRSTPLPSRHRYWTPSSVRHSASASFLSTRHPTDQPLSERNTNTTTPPRCASTKHARNRSDVVTPVVTTPDGKSLKSAVLSPVKAFGKGDSWVREEDVLERGTGVRSWEALKTGRVLRPDEELSNDTARNPSPRRTTLPSGPKSTL